MASPAKVVWTGCMNLCAGVMSFADGLKSLKSLVKDTRESSKDSRESSAERHERRVKDFQSRLRRAGEKVRARGLLTPPPPGERGIAVLLLVIDGLPYEQLWREWAAQDDSVKVRFFIHAKHPDRVKSSWVRERLIRRSFRPEWGSIEIVRAELELLQTAIKEESGAQRLLLASETCLPIVPLPAASAAMFEGERSWVHARSSPNNGYSTAQQFDPLIEDAGLSRDAVWKADQWCLLTRYHAEAILELPRVLGEELWPYFKRGRAMDEMYLSTCLGVLGELKEEEGGGKAGQQPSPPPPSSILSRRVTFCYWGVSPKSPETFHAPLSPDMLRAARKEGCLLARKFAPGAVSEEAWRLMMVEGGGEQQQENGQGQGEAMEEGRGEEEGARVVEKRARDEEGGGEEGEGPAKRLASEPAEEAES